VVGAASIYDVSGVLVGNPALPAAERLKVSIVGQTVAITGFELLPPGRISFTIKNIRSPGSAPSGLFDIRTTDALGQAYDTCPPNVTVVPAMGQLYTVQLLLPMAGETGPINVSFATQGTVMGSGKIKIKFPLSFTLPSAMVASKPGGVLSPKAALQTEIELGSNTVIVHVSDAIPQGWLSFQLESIRTPLGMAAGNFEISTWDFGKPERIYDTVVHRLVNPVDLDYWYAGDAHAPGVATQQS
jgi:hypothetical protein